MSRKGNISREMPAIAIDHIRSVATPDELQASIMKPLLLPITGSSNRSSQHRSSAENFSGDTTCVSVGSNDDEYDDMSLETSSTSSSSLRAPGDAASSALDAAEKLLRVDDFKETQLVKFCKEVPKFLWGGSKPLATPETFCLDLVDAFKLKYQADTQFDLLSFHAWAGNSEHDTNSMLVTVLGNQKVVGLFCEDMKRWFQFYVWRHNLETLLKDEESYVLHLELNSSARFGFKVYECSSKSSRSHGLLLEMDDCKGELENILGRKAVAYGAAVIEANGARCFSVDEFVKAVHTGRKENKVLSLVLCVNRHANLSDVKKSKCRITRLSKTFTSNNACKQPRSESTIAVVVDESPRKRKVYSEMQTGKSKRRLRHCYGCKSTESGAQESLPPLYSKKMSTSLQVTDTGEESTAAKSVSKEYAGNAASSEIQLSQRRSLSQSGKSNNGLALPEKIITETKSKVASRAQEIDTGLVSPKNIQPETSDKQKKKLRFVIDNELFTPSGLDKTQESTVVAPVDDTLLQDLVYNGTYKDVLCFFKEGNVTEHLLCEDYVSILKRLRSKSDDRCMLEKTSELPVNDFELKQKLLKIYANASQAITIAKNLKKWCQYEICLKKISNIWLSRRGAEEICEVRMVVSRNRLNCPKEYCLVSPWQPVATKAAEYEGLVFSLHNNVSVMKLEKWILHLQLLGKRCDGETEKLGIVTIDADKIGQNCPLPDQSSDLELVIAGSDFLESARVTLVLRRERIDQKILQKKRRDGARALSKVVDWIENFIAETEPAQIYGRDNTSLLKAAIVFEEAEFVDRLLPFGADIHGRSFTGPLKILAANLSDRITEIVGVDDDKEKCKMQRRKCLEEILGLLCK